MLCDPEVQLALSELLVVLGQGNSGLGPLRSVWRAGSSPSLAACWLWLGESQRMHLCDWE